MVYSAIAKEIKKTQKKEELHSFAINITNEKRQKREGRCH